MYDGDITEVTLNCSQNITNAVVDMFGTDTKFEPQPDGITFNVTVEVAVSPVFLSWVFMLGDNIKIVSPKNVKEQLVSMANTVININKE